MKRIILFLSFIVCVGLLWGCISPAQYPIGKKPVNPFTLTDSYLTDGAFFQQRENLIISGRSEEGVVIVATLYDENDRIIDQDYSYVMESGLWKIELTSPSASYKSYHLVIDDSVYQERITNIRFGDVWLLAGEGFINQPLSEINQHLHTALASAAPILGFYEQGFNGGEWLDPTAQDFEERVSAFAYFFGEGLARKLEIPVAIILAQVEESHLDAWVSSELISTKETVRQFANLNNRLTEEISGSKTNYDQMGYLFSSKIKPILKMRFKGILWYQGISDLKALADFNTESKNYYLTLYSKTLTYLLNDYYLQLDDEVDIYIIQEPSYDDSEYIAEDVVGLRAAQAMGSYFYTFTSIVTTYDLHQAVDYDEFEEPLYLFGALDIEQVANRVVLATRTKSYHERNNYLAPNYTTLVFTNNYIKIAFTSPLKKVNEINSLRLLDQQGEEIAIEYVIDQEWLIITWRETTEPITLGTLLYAWDASLVTSNLYSQYGVAVVPFQIRLN